MYSTDKDSLVIKGKMTEVITVTLRTETLQTIRIPLYIKVEGYHIPFMITIQA